MKILFFTENSHCGGLDSFLIALINHWPYADDDLVLACNRRHPGLAVIERRLKRPCAIVRHRIPLQWELMRTLTRIPGLGSLLRLLSPILRYSLFAWYVVALRHLFVSIAADRLMVVNGGYPGGDTNRAATIAWAAQPNRVPAIHNIHNLAIRPRWWERAIENTIDRRVSRATRAFVSVSGACSDALRNRPGIGFNATLKIIPDGIEPMQFGPDATRPGIKRSLGLSDTTPLCLMLGTYEARKGHQFLLDAFRRVLVEIPEARLVICGYGYPEQIAAVRSLVAAGGLDETVRLEGFRDDVPALLREASVLLVSSQAFESFGLSIVEAWAAGVPVVATRVGGIPEVIGDGAGGFCVSSDDIEGYARAVVRLLKDGSLRRTMGEAGLQRFRARFTAGRMALEYAQLIRGGKSARESSGAEEQG